HQRGRRDRAGPRDVRDRNEDRAQLLRALRRLQPRRPRRRPERAVVTLRSPVAVAALLMAGALAAWAATVARMRGMDAGPGTDLGGLGWYLGIWVTMMAAMMLPSVAPMALLF